MIRLMTRIIPWHDKSGIRPIMEVEPTGHAFPGGAS